MTTTVPKTNTILYTRFSNSALVLGVPKTALMQELGVLYKIKTMDKISIVRYSFFYKKATIVLTKQK